MKKFIGLTLCHLLILTVSLASPSIKDEAISHSNSAHCSLSSYPYASSVLNCHLDQPNYNLLSFNNKNSSNYIKHNLSFERALRHNDRSTHHSPEYIFCALLTCLWYEPLLSIPPPRA